MSYNLHIIREDNINNSITYDEIVRLVNTYSELNLRDKMEIKLPTEEVMTVTGAYIIWNKNEFNVVLSYHEGKISSNYTSDDGISKLKEIAHQLKAKVIGDEGEEY